MEELEWHKLMLTQLRAFANSQGTAPSSMEIKQSTVITLDLDIKV